MSFLSFNFLKKDNRLGTVKGKRRYDIPLNKDSGTGFLILLMSLMTFLLFMASFASMTLSSMTQSWSSGLENKLTIEILAENPDGSLRSDDEIASLARQTKDILDQNIYIESAEILSAEQVQELIEPWLGSGLALDDIPLPGLISTQLNQSGPQVMQSLQQDLASVTNAVRLDTHESWLSDLLSFTRALQFTSVFIMIVIAVTTITAVAGAVLSRIAIHRDDVELLHLMGANDLYITRQFQRHALILALQGTAIGTLAGFITLIAIGLFLGDLSSSLLPSFSVGIGQVLILTALPLVICTIAAVTARFTVLRALALMP